MMKWANHIQTEIPLSHTQFLNKSFYIRLSSQELSNLCKIIA